MADKDKAKKFISHKELSNAFGMDPQTFKREVKRLKDIVIHPYQQFYSPKDQEKIFRQFGNPFQE